MDPVHLSTHELDYELEIRGVYNLSTARQKTQCLREFLIREVSGESTISRSSLNSLNVTSELSTCSKILNDINEIMQQSGFKASSRLDCRSRLLHIIERIKRIQPVSSQEQSAAGQLIDAAEVQLAFYAQPSGFTGTSRSRRSMSTAQSTSPLADAIERIQMSRQEVGHQTPRPLDRMTAQDNQQMASSIERRSLLNPSVQEFVPLEGAVGGQHEFQFPIQFDQPPPAYSRNEQFFSQQNFRVEPAQAASRPAVDNNAQLGPTRNNFPVHQEFRPNRPASLFSANLGDFRGEFNNHYQRVQRKSVPVHQWKLTYSGDGIGIHLYDFLSEIEMLQRSEGVSDDELLSSVVHLLTGRARLWYRSWFDTFGSWTEMVSAMKTEFLPPKHDFKLLTSISNRKQKPSETFAEYLNMMRSLFKHLSIGISEQHKLGIIEENMLSKYAIATSVLDIASLDQLSKVCRRVDYAYARTTAAVPFERHTDQRFAFRNGQNQNRSRALHAVETMHQCPNTNDYRPGFNSGMDEELFQDRTQENYDQQPNGEILEMRRRQNNPSSDAAQQGPRECFNCRRPGHSHAVCPTPQNGKFCFRCGSRDVTTFTCRNCAKNGSPDSAAQESAPNPHQSN